MSDLPDDLCEVINMWDNLSQEVKAGIVVMIKAIRQG